jgi:hypothetical protein
MKFLGATLFLISASAFAQETEICFGSAYWKLMDKSQRICNWQEQVFGNEHGLSCNLKHHNDPNVCYSQCIDATGRLVAKLRVDMISDCDFEIVQFRKTKTTWYR